MTAVPHVLAVRCSWCTKERPPHRVHRLASNQVICDHCLDWHYHALDVLGGAVPKGCQFCGQSWEKLCAIEREASNVRMYVLPADGILAVACKPCMLDFVAKKRHLVDKTSFGRNVLKL